MELRNQGKEIGMPNSLSYNPPVRELSSKLLSSSSVISPSTGRREEKRDEIVNGASDHQIHGHGRYSSPDPVSVSVSVVVRYRECLKNHAANTGGHVLDGCGEFMPAGEEGTPEALKCAACDCHRSFHRKEVDGEPQFGVNCYYYNPNERNSNSRSRIVPHSQIPPPSIPPLTMAFNGGGMSSSEDRKAGKVVAPPVRRPEPPLVLSKKRFRTKFSQEQKEKMLEFADKVGWRFQKQDEALIQQFCGEVGVKRQVLKVWMHNNKHSMKKLL